MTFEQRQRLNEMSKSKTEHLDRYNRCTEKFKRLSRPQIVDWLNRLPGAERELCKEVLNNLLKRKKMAKEKINV